MARASLLTAGCLIGSTGTVTAHEEYVVDDAQRVDRWEVLRESLSEPTVVGPLLLGGLGLLVALAVYWTWRPLRGDIGAFRDVMAGYRSFLPWLLRISLGIPLIGAGFGGYLFSPALEMDLRLVQVALGSLILFGLGTRCVAAGTAVLYVGTAIVHPVALLQFEFLGGLIAIVLIGSGRPSADHTFQSIVQAPETVYGRIDVVNRYADRFQRWIEPFVPLAATSIRIGLGLTFLYLGLSQKLLQPGLALAVVEQYQLTAVVPVAPALWILAAGLTEIALGTLLVMGAFTRATASVALVTFTLTMFALPDDPVLAHVSLFGLASALIITGAGPYSFDYLVRRPSGHPIP